MATLLSIADGGNMMTASTWGVVEPTSFQGTPTVALSTTLASVNQFTATAFTLANAVTISGIALQLSGRVAAPTGTFNVQLYNVTSATIVGQVTINIIDYLTQMVLVPITLIGFTLSLHLLQQQLLVTLM
jgi:hypothetical protein